MQDKLTAKPVRKRRFREKGESRAERSASTRQCLVDAAIRCLCRVGYASTTTQLVMEEAGVSRGAMLHHFPTKLDLVIAVGEFAAAAQNRYVRSRLGEIAPGLGRFLALTDATWEAICQPPALALIEIMIAARSDPGLSERFPTVIESLERQQLNDVCAMADELGIRDRGAVDRMVRLHRAAMRGLAIERVFSGDDRRAEEGMELLDWYKRLLAGALLTNQDHPLVFRPVGSLLAELTDAQEGEA